MLDFTAIKAATAALCSRWSDTKRESRLSKWSTLETDESPPDYTVQLHAVHVIICMSVCLSSKLHCVPKNVPPSVSYVFCLHRILIKFGN